MKLTRFNELPPEDRERIDAYLDGTISPGEFDALQLRMKESAELRTVMRRYLTLDDSLRSELPARAEGGATAMAFSVVPAPSQTSVTNPQRKKTGAIRWFKPLAIAASIAAMAGIALWMQKPNADGTAYAGGGTKPTEPVATGFAVVGRLFDAQWPDADSQHQAGDTLGAEAFRLASGTAEIQFFSGATMTIEGPAEITLKSAWEAICDDGAVRMRVPPAARGFKLRAPSTEIVDLGTEFGLSVRDGKGHVEVFEGEIALHPEGADQTLLKKGGALALQSGGAPVAMSPGQIAYPNADRNGTRAAEQRQADFARWQSHRDALVKDERLLLYYTFDRAHSGDLIPNLSLPRNADRDGAVVLAEAVDGRWPGLKSALEFRRPGARVRANIPGEFSAFTFACWVRIDSLDRWYNALFMADGYENGEPHWQIRNDGKMMLSVMVDDSRSLPNHPESRFHHVYYSPPMWSQAMCGKWQHLASVFDPQTRQVSHYVNGERISREAITTEFFVNKLRIGNVEVGNWGQPFREDPTWAIRNLNGRMDELAIFNAALSDEEIAKLYEGSRVERR